LYPQVAHKGKFTPVVGASKLAADCRVYGCERRMFASVGGEPAVHREHSSSDLHVARAELVLARPSYLPLRALSIHPDDPLQTLANALGDVRVDLGEAVQVCLDLIPLTPARIRHLARRAASHSRGNDVRPFGVVADVAAELLGEFLPIARTPAGARSRNATPSPQRVANKFATDEPSFAIQVLIRCVSEIPGRAQAHLRSVIGAFDIFRGENYWRVRGPRVLGWHFGADTVLVRRRFDRRFRTGLAKPRAGSFVTTSEIAGLLKPPS
jgi:hypothetical protein